MSLGGQAGMGDGGGDLFFFLTWFGCCILRPSIDDPEASMVTLISELLRSNLLLRDSDRGKLSLEDGGFDSLMIQRNIHRVGVLSGLERAEQEEPELDLGRRNWSVGSELILLFPGFSKNCPCQWTMPSWLQKVERQEDPCLQDGCKVTLVFLEFSLDKTESVTSLTT